MKSKLSEFLDKRRVNSIDPVPMSSIRTEYDLMWYLRGKKAVLDAFPKEVVSSSGVGNWLLVRPHNYMVILPVLNDFPALLKKFTGLVESDKNIEIVPQGRRGKPSWYKIKVKNYHGCTIELTTKSIIAYLYGSNSRWVHSSRGKEEAKKIKEEYKERVLGVLKNFKRDFGVKTDFRAWGSFRKIKKKKDKRSSEIITEELEWGWVRKEIGIKGLKIQEKIPSDLYWVGEKTKKQYPHEIEVFGKDAEIYLTRLIENDSLRSFSPDLIEELISIKKMMCSLDGTMNAVSNAILLIAQTLKKLEEKI